MPFPTLWKWQQLVRGNQTLAQLLGLAIATVAARLLARPMPQFYPKRPVPMSTVFVLVWKSVLPATHQPVEMDAGKVPAGSQFDNQPRPAHTRPGYYYYTEFNPFYVLSRILRNAVHHIQGGLSKSTVRKTSQALLILRSSIVSVANLRIAKPHVCQGHLSIARA